MGGGIGQGCQDKVNLILGVQTGKEVSDAGDRADQADRACLDPGGVRVGGVRPQDVADQIDPGLVVTPDSVGQRGGIVQVGAEAERCPRGGIVGGKVDNGVDQRLPAAANGHRCESGTQGV